jgi:flavin-binding protein dodecin
MYGGKQRRGWAPTARDVGSAGPAARRARFRGWRFALGPVAPSLLVGTAPTYPALVTHTSPDQSSGGSNMSVAKVTEISSTSTKSFEDAINQGIARANATLRNVRSAWIKEQQVRVENGRPSEYQVNMMVTFVLDD